MVEENKLYVAARKFVKAAIESLAKECAEGPPERVAGAMEYARAGEQIFQLREYEFPYWHRTFWNFAQKRRALPEYAFLIQEMKDDPVLERYVDAIVGTERARTHLQGEGIADHLLYRTADSCGGLTFDATIFKRVFAEFLAGLKGDDVEFVAVAPIRGFKSKSFPIQLGENLEIDRLTDEEIRRCLRINIPVGFESGGIVHLDGGAGVRYSFPEPKRIGSSAFDSARITRQQEDLAERLSQVSHVLRLFKKGTIRISSFAMFSVHWPFDGVTSAGVLEPTGAFGLYELDESETNKFSEFWKDVISARKTKFIDAAIRRFGYAGERHRVEDKLVDLMICAESLFLSDVGDAAERGEMRFRISLRSGLFSEAEQLANYRLMKAAYNVRSSIVHGGSPDLNDMKLDARGKVPLAEFVDAVEHLLRSALHKAIKIQPSGNRLVDWDTLVFGKPED